MDCLGYVEIVSTGKYRKTHQATYCVPAHKPYKAKQPPQASLLSVPKCSHTAADHLVLVPKFIALKNEVLSSQPGPNGAQSL